MELPLLPRVELAEPRRRLAGDRLEQAWSGVPRRGVPMGTFIN